MKRPSWLAVLVVLVVAVVFGRSATHRFVLLDDDANIYRNRLVNPARVESLPSIWGAPYNKLYIPVTYSTWLALAAVATVEPGEQRPRAFAGLDPTHFHTANIVLHALSALLVLVILRRCLGDDLAAAFGALLFAAHPVQVEPVAWASGTKDVLSGFLALGSLALYVRHACRSRAGGSGRCAYWAGLALLALAVLAKPSAVALPLIAAALDLGVLRREPRRVAFGLAPWLLVAVAGAVPNLLFQPAAAVSAATAPWQRPLVAADAVAFYIRHLAVPIAHAPFYGRTPERVLETGALWWTWIAPVALFVFALLWRKRSPVPLAALAIFVAGLAPVLGLVSFEFQMHSTVADRYLYLSMLGPALLVAWWLREHRGALGYGVLALALGGYAARASMQVGRWKNTRVLLEHTLAVNPHSDFAHGNLAQVLEDVGELDEARQHYAESVRLRPDSAQGRLNYGSFLGRSGQLAEAEEQLQEAVRLDPSYAAAHATLASALAGQDRLPEAIQHLREAASLEPDFAPAQMQLGQLLEFTGDAEGAIAAYREALRAEPELLEPRVRLGTLYLQAGHTSAAIEFLTEAVARDPRRGDAQAELGRALLIDGRPHEAVEHLGQALRLRPDLEHVRGLLDAALREAQ